MTNGEGRPPLEAIREVERQVAARLEAARTAAAERLTRARLEAERLREEARDRGQRAAERRYQEGLRQAEAEADTERGAGAAQVERLRQVTAQRADLVAGLLACVLPAGGEGG